MTEIIEQERLCPSCNKDMSHKTKQAQYCTPECYQWSIRTNKSKICRECHESIFMTNRRNYCSRNCRKKQHEKRRNKKDMNALKKKYCDRMYMVGLNSSEQATKDARKLMQA